MIFKNTTLACALFVQMTIGMMQPNSPLIVSDPRFPQRLIALPGDLLRELLFMNAKFYMGTNVHSLAKGYLALAGTNKALRTHMKKTGTMLGAVNKLPYTLGALYLAQKITALPDITPTDIPQWLKDNSPRFAIFDVKGSPSHGPQLIEAIEKGNQEEINACFSMPNLDLNYRKGRTPLMEAAHNKSPEVAKRLLAAGANPNARSHKDNNRFPLFDAAHYNQPDIAELLLACGAKVNMQDGKGVTALMRAIQMREAYGDTLQIIQLLLTAKANVNLQSKDGATALICAAGDEQADVVQLLIDAGTDLDLKTQNCKIPEANGKTALDIARSSYHHTDIVTLLESAAAAKKEKQKTEQSKKP